MAREMTAPTARFQRSRTIGPNRGQQQDGGAVSDSRDELTRSLPLALERPSEPSQLSIARAQGLSPCLPPAPMARPSQVRQSQTASHVLEPHSLIHFLPLSLPPSLPPSFSLRPFLGAAVPPSVLSSVPSVPPSLPRLSFYLSLRPSVPPSLRPCLRPSIHPSIHPSNHLPPPPPPFLPLFLAP